MNIKELLAQSEWWITADRVPIRLTEMDADHRRHTLAMLRRRASYNRKMIWRIDCVEAMREAAHRGHQDPRMITPPKGPYEIEDSDEEWIERQPLIIELARLVKIDEYGDNVVDGEVVTHELEGPEDNGSFTLQRAARRALQGDRGDLGPEGQRLLGQ